MSEDSPGEWDRAGPPTPRAEPQPAGELDGLRCIYDRAVRRVLDAASGVDARAWLDVALTANANSRALDRLGANSQNVEHMQRRIESLTKDLDAERELRRSVRVKYQREIVAHLQRACEALLKPELSRTDIVQAREAVTNAVAMLDPAT